MSHQTATPDPRDKIRYYQYKTLVNRITFFLLGIYFFCVMKIKINGLENFPKTGGVILVANHLSNYDPLLMIYLMPRPVLFMTKASLFKNPIMGEFYRQLGGFPINRGEKDEWAINYVHNILTTGKVLGIYLEGTQSRNGALQKTKIGTAYMAIRANCPIVPMAINGTQQVLSQFPKRTEVTFNIASPIYPDPDINPEALTDKVMYSIAAMLPPKMQGDYKNLTADK